MSPGDIHQSEVVLDFIGSSGDDAQIGFGLSAAIAAGAEGAGSEEAEDDGS